MIGDSEIACFNCTETLTHLYLECPSNVINRDEESTPQEEAERPTGRSRILMQVIRENRMVPQVEVGFYFSFKFNFINLRSFFLFDI